MPTRALLFSLILVMAAPLPVWAAEIILGYQAVMHVRDSQSAPVLDDPAHVIGTAAFRGLAIFDGKPVPHRYDGWFDLANGSGPFHGYASWIFPGGTTLKAAYDGKAESTADGFKVTARFRDFSGTGRFAGVTGEGAFAGTRLEPIDVGGSTFLDGELRLTVPE